MLDPNHRNFLNTNLKCTVLCGGKGTRMAPLSLEKQKVMLLVNEKPILKYVIDYWKQYTTNFIFIVRYKKEDVINYVKSLVDITAEIIEEPRDGMGIAEAIELVEGKVNGNHIVVLGDCICKGEFVFPKKFKQGVGVFKTDEEKDIRRSYSIEIEHKNGSISKVVEKPKQLSNNLCGMGVYFFNNKIFNYIKDTTRSKLRNEVEITDAIGNMIAEGEDVFPIFFRGKYLNITIPDDIKIAENILC